jgi:hypothetical protein
LVAGNSADFASVECEDPQDAVDAARELDGRTLCGYCVNGPMVRKEVITLLGSSPSR